MTDKSKLQHMGKTLNGLSNLAPKPVTQPPQNNSPATQGTKKE
jgi:hypothetical protein